MIDHSQCDHPRTPSARAKCRRANGVGSQSGERTTRATPKKEWGGKAHHNPDRERNTGQVPKDRAQECHVCHVERICARGTDPKTNILLYVGERCMWRVERESDFQMVEA